MDLSWRVLVATVGILDNGVVAAIDVLDGADRIGCWDGQPHV